MAASRGGIAVLFRKKKQDFFDENREADCACCRHGDGKEEDPACLLGRMPRRRCGNMTRMNSSCNEL